MLSGSDQCQSASNYVQVTIDRLYVALYREPKFDNASLLILQLIFTLIYNIVTVLCSFVAITVNDENGYTKVW